MEYIYIQIDIHYTYLCIVNLHVVQYIKINMCIYDIDVNREINIKDIQNQIDKLIAKKIERSINLQLDKLIAR